MIKNDIQIENTLLEYLDLFGTHEIGRWYMKESELDVADEAETVKEDNASKRRPSSLENGSKRTPTKKAFITRISLSIISTQKPCSKCVLILEKTTCIA